MPACLHAPAWLKRLLLLARLLLASASCSEDACVRGAYFEELTRRLAEVCSLTCRCRVRPQSPLGASACEDRSHNGLVLDPVQEEIRRHYSNVWSEEEKQVRVPPTASLLQAAFLWGA